MKYYIKLYIKVLFDASPKPQRIFKLFILSIYINSIFNKSNIKNII